jgi:ubiquinone/menaquinone biosynthesis C-methylase UbiE
VSFDYQAVSGDYQYNALHTGPAMQRFWHGGKLAMIDRLVRPKLGAGARLLEIGCGSGNLLLQAAVADSFPVALDLSTQALTFVRSRLQAARSGDEAPRGYGCTQAIGESLPLESASFDYILLSEVIEHLAAPEKVIQEAARVLRPGGRLLVTTPNYRSLWPVMEWTVDLLNMAPKMAGEQHISRFHLASLKSLLTEAGLQPEYNGSIYGVSPFLSMISSNWAMRRLERELERQPSLGMVLVAVAVKP